MRRAKGGGSTSVLPTLMGSDTDAESIALARAPGGRVVGAGLATPVRQERLTGEHSLDNNSKQGISKVVRLFPFNRCLGLFTLGCYFAATPGLLLFC